MEWLARVRLIAETDRVLQAKHRKAHKRWTARLTALQLGLPASTVSMCVQLERGLDQWPELSGARSLRHAYDLYRQKRRSGNGRANGTHHR